MLVARRGIQALGSERKCHSWTDWLALAGLLDGGVRRSRGVTVVAKDGHLCKSLLERQVDDFFYDNNIEHEPEPWYPYDSELNPHGYRADWKLRDGTFVEALGFPDDTTYMAKADHKIRLAQQFGIDVVVVTEDVLRSLPAIFSRWMP
ncbi:hypothetical protein B8W67_19955 [Mycolicibacillus koreensis]|uniref:Uncharacterized protein n=2 Tax=Mycolicibacillus koreensis TaxID=1069220 RepID=A0AA91PAQ9_9MYCO|nr:hypothetical protein B8W67_19955 [Mycolicibacillus koreensis]